MVVRSQLTRNIAKLYPEIRDEIVTSFGDVLDLRGHGEVSAFTRVTMDSFQQRAQSGRVYQR